MITLSGILYNISSSNFTDRRTGEMKLTHAAEIITVSRGKSEILTLKIESALVDQWMKCKGREITVEVRAWAMLNNEKTGVNTGYALADKTALPVVQHPPLKAAA